MNESMKAYMGAVLDGSYFSISSSKGWSASIRIRRSERRLLEIVQEVFGGNIGHSRKGDIFWLNYNGRACTELLILVMPYMKIKQEHAQILLELNHHIEQRTASGLKPGSRLSEAERKYRDDLSFRLRVLNG